jgi:hypothetical protein
MWQSEDGRVEREIYDDQVTSIRWQSIEKYLERMRDQRPRPEGQGSIECMDRSDSGEWLVVGSSRRYLAIYNLLLGAFTNAIPLSSVPAKVILNGTEIVTVGGDEYVSHWSINGNGILQARTSSNILTDVCVNNGGGDTSLALLTCGNSSRIDVFLNFSLISFSFSFPTAEN